MKLHFVHSSRFRLVGDALQGAFRAEFESGNYKVTGSDPVHGHALTICPDYGYDLETMRETVQERADDEVRRLMKRFSEKPVEKRSVRIFIASQQILWCEGVSDTFEPKSTESLWDMLRTLGVKRCSVGTAFSVTYADAPDGKIWPSGICLSPLEVNLNASEGLREWGIANPDDPCAAFWKLVQFSEPPRAASDDLVRIVGQVRALLIACN